MNYSMFRVERRVRSAPLLVLFVLFAALVGCGNSDTNGSLTNCDIVVQINKEIEPLQKKLQSSVLQGDVDPRAAAQLQAEDYDSIGAKIRELSGEMSASELRDLTLTLSGRYTDIGQSIERDLAAPPQPAGSEPLLRNGERLLNDLAATTHDYRAQCPVN